MKVSQLKENLATDERGQTRILMRNILSILPDVESLKKLSQSLAMLDAIMSPDWEYRYYSFNSEWNKDEMVASMRDGSGDEYFIWFTSNGAIVKGFAHESLMSPFVNEPIEVCKGVLDSEPSEFKDFLSEPAFSLEATTFCIWRKFTDSTWQIGEIEYPNGNDPDGMEELLFILDGKPETYKDFAEEYYEQEISISSIKSLYEHRILTNELVRTLKKDIPIKDLQKDINEIGYPYP